MSFDNNDVDVVIVGAGPVGLLNAIGLLSKNPELKLVMMEKYDKYSRHHVVQLDYKQVAKYIKEIGEPINPILKELCAKVKKNKFIRTSDIEQDLKALALELNAEIRVEEVVNVQEDVLDAFPNVNLILGADGTHSVVSKQMFGTDNIEKYPFDYVMQFRYQIAGDVERIELPDLIKFMQSYGLTGDEYVGKKDANGNTPVTFQLMINREQFETLYPVATSKKPIFPFRNDDENLDKVEDILLERINGYLGLRLNHFIGKNQVVDLTAATISVNEAPATRAKKLVTRVDEKTIVLVGDAAMGLSYFKGLNAGIESSARLLPALLEELKKSPDELDDYFKWFDEKYAPGKIKEVKNFSTYRIRLAVTAFRALNYLFGKDFLMRQEEANQTVSLYLGYLASLKRDEKGEIINKDQAHDWSLYPHKADKSFNVMTFTPVPARYLKKNWKNVKDAFTPYKSTWHLLRDVFSPLRAAFHILAGALEIALALPMAIMSAAATFLASSTSLKENLKTTSIVFFKRIAEGSARMFFGTSLAISSLVMPLRVLVRGLITLGKRVHSEPLLVETNPGMQQRIHAVAGSGDSIEKLNALSVDMHRKYNKSVGRGQASEIDPEKEKNLFKQCRSDDIESYREYFRLFKVEYPINDVEEKPVLIHVVNHVS